MSLCEKQRYAWLIYGNYFPSHMMFFCPLHQYWQHQRQLFSLGDPTSKERPTGHRDLILKINRFAFVTVVSKRRVLVLSLLNKKKKKGVIQNKDKKSKPHKHTQTHKHTCMHLFVSGPVGICHTPGRFWKLGRWCSTIKRSQSLNQSPACHMKGPTPVCVPPTCLST